MPDVRLDVRQGWSQGEKQALLKAVHGAMVETLKIPEWDKVLFLNEHAPEEFLTPPGKSDRYTRVEITMFPGRSLETKRHLYQAVVRNLEALGVPRADVKIVLLEPPMENWGIRGGQMASEVNLGYAVRV